MLGVSASAVRNYVDRYDAHLSQSATETPRTFTEDDLRLFAYVRTQTDNGLTHDEIEAQIAAGALEDFEWQPPTPQEQEYREAERHEQTSLVPAAEMRALARMLQDAQDREQKAREDARQREVELQDRINELQRELGKVEGELLAMKAQKRRAPEWWRRLFGGRDDG